MLAMESISCLIGGLGLFFVGLMHFSATLRHLAGGKARRFLEKVGSSRIISMATGVITGAAVQSGRVTAVILAGLISGDALTVRQALPMLFWSNVGCAMMVLAVVVPIKSAAFLIVGISGVLYAFDICRRNAAIYATLFYLALFMLGLILVKEGMVALLQAYGYTRVNLDFTYAPMLAFGLGVGLTILVQSHISIIMIAVAMASAEMLAFENVLLLIYGTHLGSGLVTLIFSLHVFHGQPRRILMSHVIFNGIGVAAFLLLYIVEKTLQVPLIMAMAAQISASAVYQSAFVTILFSIVTASLCTPMVDLIASVVAKICPRRSEDELLRPAYINDQSADDPALAALLAKKEIRHLLSFLPIYLDHARSQPQSIHTHNVETMHLVFLDISAKLSDFITKAIRNKPTLDTAEELLKVETTKNLLFALEQDVYALVECITRTPDIDTYAGTLCDGVVESADMLILNLMDVVTNQDKDDSQLLLALTDGSSATMQQIRRTHYSDEANQNEGHAHVILTITHAYERIAATVSLFVVVLTEN